MPEQPKLSDSQRRIVESDRLDRHMLVIAPPGSGKTHTISKRIEWLLARRLAEPEQILALTYTNKAGRELKERISENASPHVRASTLHSWAYDFLRTHGREAGVSEHFQVSDEFRRDDLIRTAATTAGIPMLLPDQVRKAGFWLGEHKRDPIGRRRSARHSIRRSWRRWKRRTGSRCAIRICSISTI